MKNPGRAEAGETTGSMSAKVSKQVSQPWFGGGLGAVLVAVVGMFLYLFPVGKRLRDKSFDLPFLFRTEQKIDDVVIIFLNERSYSELHQVPESFDRGLHARLLQRLKAEGAKMVVFDILFIDPKPTNAIDHAFAQAMRDHGKVILGGQHELDSHFYKNEKTMPPVDPFRDAAAGWGIAHIHRDTDFAARVHHPGTDMKPSLAWVAAELYGAAVTKNPAVRDRERWMNYYAREPFPAFAYSDIILNLPMPPGTFKDKVVFVGSGEVAGYTGQEKEQYRYPWTDLRDPQTDRKGHFPVGVEFHAMTFANLVRQDWLTRLPTWLEVTGLLLFGAAFGYGLTLLRPFSAAGVCVLAAVSVFGLAFLLFAKWNLWFSWLILVEVQLPLALAWATLFHSIRSYMETQFLQTSLSVYFSPARVKQILRQPELLKPGATRQTVSILFSDIEGFSKVTEMMRPEDLVKLLNKYYETAIASIYATEGTVMDLIGDAIFAIWNAPEEQADHQDRAFRAALLLQQRLKEFRESERGLPLQTRVGLHTGTVCVDNIGSSTRFDYTAIGDEVNMASRLEGLNKHLGTLTLATREIQAGFEEKYVWRLMGHFKFKGKFRPVEVYELIGPLEKAEESRAWREAFAEGLHQFQMKNFTRAEAEFKRTLDLRPDDGPAAYYLKRVAQLRASPPPSDWKGEIDLESK